MSGTIPNLPLSMQRDKDTDLPLRGGKLYFFQAGTVATPQSAFQDTALSIALPNPVTLDGSGRIPSFYLADGSIHVRLTNSAGVVQFDQDNLLVIGPSSGGGGGGSTVDPTAIFQTGDTIWLDQGGARTGWVRDNGRTIGSAVSGASERANADCQNLFTFLWNTYSDAQCPVVGGRGVSAAADWAANKQITLPDKRGYIPGGLDDMGNIAAGRYVGVPVVAGSVTTAGSLLGEAAHTLTQAELPNYTLPYDEPNSGQGHQHTVNTGVPFNINSGSTQSVVATGTTSSGFSPTGITIHSGGGGGSHNVTQRTVLGSFYRKL